MSEITVASSPTPTSLPLSPPLSTSQTPSASPSSFSQAEIFEKHGDIVNVLQKQQTPPLVQNSIPPLSPTSPQPSKSAPTSKAGPDVSSNASLPNAWKIVGSPSRPHFVPQASGSGRSSNGTHEDDTNEYTVNKCFTLGKSNGLDCEEELDLGLSSDDAHFDGSGLIGTRRSSECRVLPAERAMQYQYNPDAKFATGNASAPGFYMDVPRHPAGRRGSDMEVGENMGLSTSANASTSWGSLGVQWTAGPSMWKGTTNGNGIKNSTAGGSPPPPPDEVSAMHSVPFSHFDGQFSGTKSDSRFPIGSGPLVAGSTSVGVGSAYLSDEYDQIQKQQLRKAQSLSFAHGQQETDFFGTSKNTNAQFLNSSSNDDQADGTGARNSSLSSIPDFSDDLDTHRDATGLPEHPLPLSTTPSQLRGLESNFCQLLPSMMEEKEGAHDVDESDISPSNASYAAYTLPKMRSRSKSFASTYGMVNSASPSNSHSGSSPMNQIRPLNGSSPKHQPMYGSITAPSSPYHQKPAMTSAASIWQDDAASAEISRQLSNMSAATHLNTLNAPNTQYRMPITTPNEYNWLLTQSASNSSSQHAASLSIGMNGNGNGINMYTSQTGNSSPEQLERVRIQRRYSLNPALSGGAQGGMTMNAGMEMRGVIGTDNVNGGHGMGTGSYGDYRYLESGQGLGMLNRSVQQEYAHLNQRRHSVAGPTLSFVNPSQSQYLSNALNALHLDDDLIYGNQQRHHGFSSSVEETDLNDYFDNDQPRAARVAAATACGNYGGILSNGMSNPNSIMSSMGGQGASMVQGLSHSASRDADAHLGQGVPLHAIRHHGPLYIIEFKAGRSDLFYLGPESVSQQVKKGDLVIVEADRGKDLGKVVNDNITPIEVQMLQQQRAEAAAVAEMGISIMPDGSVNRVIGAIPGSGGPVKELHPKRIYGLAQPAEVTMLVIKCQDEAKAILVCQTKVRQKNLPMEVVDAEYQWDRRKLTFYFIAEHRIDFRELVRDLFKIYKTRIWMCSVNPNASSNFEMNILNK